MGRQTTHPCVPGSHLTGVIVSGKPHERWLDGIQQRADDNELIPVEALKPTDASDDTSTVAQKQLL